MLTVTLKHSNHESVGAMIHREKDWNAQIEAQRKWHLGSGLWVDSAKTKELHVWIDVQVPPTGINLPWACTAAKSATKTTQNFFIVERRTNGDFQRDDYRGEKNNSQCRWDSQMHYIDSRHRSSFVRAKIIWRRGGDIQWIATAANWLMTVVNIIVTQTIPVVCVEMERSGDYCRGLTRFPLD